MQCRETTTDKSKDIIKANVWAKEFYRGYLYIGKKLLPGVSICAYTYICLYTEMSQIYMLHQNSIPAQISISKQGR